jgi:hypothetical protein
MPAPYPRLSGRTLLTTRPGGNTAPFLTNDDGFYVLDDKVPAGARSKVKMRAAR